MHASVMYGLVYVYLQPFVTSPVGQWSASRPGDITQRKVPSVPIE